MQIKSPILFLLAIMSLVPTLAQASAVLFIYPTLVMFEGNQRSATITITNRGDETGTFEMSWVDMAMTPEGGLVKYEGEAPWSVKSYVRYSPRRVTLAPAQSQVIRVAVQRGLDVPEGEYYSHFRVLTLNSEAPAAGLSDEEAEEAEEAEAAEEAAAASVVVIEARSAVAIPVVWRNSSATPDASIEAVQIDRDANNLSVEVRRHGPLSVRGYLHVFEKAADGTRIALADPVPLVIYPSLEARTIAIELNDGVIAANLSHGAEVFYSPDFEITDRSTVIDTYPIVP